MEGFAPIILFFVVISIITSIANAAKQKAAQQNQGDTQAAARARAEAARQQRLELARQQLQYRQQNAARPAGSMPANRAVPDKPIIPHSTDDCTGGSIHDGYHEGTLRRPAPASGKEGAQGAQGVRRASYAPGTTGQGMALNEGNAGESHSALTAAELAAKAPAKAESGTEKLAKAISSQPAIVQGVIWAEILGKPLSE